MSQDAPTLNNESQRSPSIAKEVKLFDPKTGQGYVLREYTVPQGSEMPTVALGELDPAIVNERNSTISRFSVKEIEELEDEKFLGAYLDETGAIVRRTVQVAETDTVAPEDVTNRLKMSSERLDDQHDVVTTETAVAFPTVLSYLDAYPELEGLDVTISQQRAGAGYAGGQGEASFATSGETANRAIHKVTTVRTTPPEDITLHDWLPPNQATHVFKKVSVVGTEDAPGVGLNDIAMQDKKIASGRKLRSHFYTAAWAVFTHTEQDPDTGETVQVTVEILAADEVPAAINEPFINVVSKQIDNTKFEVTTRTIAEAVVGKTFKSARNIQYQFPSWLVPGAAFVDVQADWYNYTTNVNTTWTMVNGLNKKAGQTLTVPAEVCTTYHRLRPLPEQAFQFFTVDLQLAVRRDSNNVPIVSSVNESNIICDPDDCIWSYAYATVNGPKIFNMFDNSTPGMMAAIGSGAVVLEQQFPESKPNATRYIEMMTNNERILVGVEITKWKYNLWRKVRTFIRIPNLMTPGVEAP